MEMSEAFATTVASVAPVIMLVGAVELVALEKGLRRMWVRPDVRGVPVVLAAALLWCVFAVLLCVAEAKALLWLATPGAPANPGVAEFCCTVLIVGFAWVMLVPTVRVVNLTFVPLFTRLPPKFAREASEEPPS
ncbi:hypothetical protein ACFQ6E_38440 [Streptomyces sp. NPDC056462]|uniref:hypothetical protein n=1 Tax=Streptomyces sp. NPDC056462 TaxID=3345826 RepID=UPI003681CCC9